MNLKCVCVFVFYLILAAEGLVSAFEFQCSQKGLVVVLMLACRAIVAASSPSTRGRPLPLRSIPWPFCSCSEDAWRIEGRSTSVGYLRAFSHYIPACGNPLLISKTLLSWPSVANLHAGKNRRSSFRHSIRATPLTQAYTRPTPTRPGGPCRPARHGLTLERLSASFRAPAPGSVAGCPCCYLSFIHPPCCVSNRCVSCCRTTAVASLAVGVPAGTAGTAAVSGVAEVQQKRHYVLLLRISHSAVNTARSWRAWATSRLLFSASISLCPNTLVDT